MAQPKVSILISFYNLAPYVDETLQSVLNQKTDFPLRFCALMMALQIIRSKSCASGRNGIQKLCVYL